MSDENPFDDKPAIEPEPPTRRPRKVAEEARLHPLLSNEDVEKARASARKRIEDERRIAALRAVEQEEVDRLRAEEGLTTGVSLMDELVDVHIDLPPYTPNILINGGTFSSVYWHGITYHKVPRHIADTLAEQMWRAWKQEEAVDGKSLSERMRKPRRTMINARTGAIANAPARPDA